MRNSVWIAEEKSLSEGTKNSVSCMQAVGEVVTTAEPLQALTGEIHAVLEAVGMVLYIKCRCLFVNGSIIYSILNNPQYFGKYRCPFTNGVIIDEVAL